jgi:outer membrane receptor protein involved in Fe transport
MRIAALLMAVAVLTAAPAFAQQTTGSITGRVTDAQGGAVPGATATARNTATGFLRTDTTDAEGTYRLTALPVGTYDLRIELQGFTTVEQSAVTVNVGQVIALDFTLKVASVAETVTVTSEAPLVSTTSSAVGGVVNPQTIEELPLNGRQFANLAVTIPGVGLGFHSDPTKSTQFSPQINGGNGRNVNYQIDGGDNNDDTVGGLLQLFPLEAIQEFNVLTARYKAEYGRSNGGVMNIVTKSGTNVLHGSWFTLARNDSLNAMTETERLNESEKQDYKRYQYGGSFGGPVRRDKAFFFGAVERTQQDTFQIVNTQGLFPSEDGTFATPYRETLLTTKYTQNLNAAQYLSVRYGRNQNSQPYGADPLTPVSGWGESGNKFNSFNINHNWVMGEALNEFIFQYADFRNHISANSNDPYQTFPNNVSIGQNPNTPQTTEQKKWQFRDDFSWHATGMGGIGHDFKAGVNFINEPRLFITFNVATGDYAYTHLDNNLSGPLSAVSRNGGAAEANIPTKQYAAYFQDDWRVTDRLTLNLGLRYDLVTGYAIEQSRNPNFIRLQDAARAGRFNNLPGGEAFAGFGEESQEDKDNVQPRVGFTYDLTGSGRHVARAGWGTYYDVSYTNASILFAAIDATGIGSGVIFSVSNTNGIRNPDGSFFRVGQPISNIQSQNEASTTGLPLIGHIASPRIKHPWTSQLSFGVSSEVRNGTALDIDFIHIDGHDLGWRPRPNQRMPGVGATGPRRFADLGISVANFRTNVSTGESVYDGLNLGLRQRVRAGMSFNAWYSLSRAKSTTGNGSDELDSNNIQNIQDPFGDVQNGPSGRSDALHRFTFSGVFELPGGFQVSPIIRFRSALPVNITQGYDVNQDGNNNDISIDKAFAFDGFDDNDNPKVKEIGDCKTINCGRGAPFSQVNLRVSKSFNLGDRARIEAIGEVFNLFNAKNSATFIGRRFLGTITNPTPNPDFMRPTEYAGDFQNPEQRVGQIGFRFSF